MGTTSRLLLEPEATYMDFLSLLLHLRNTGMLTSQAGPEAELWHFPGQGSPALRKMMPESWTLFLSYVKIQDTSVDSTKSSWIGEVSVPSTEKEAFFGWD